MANTLSAVAPRLLAQALQTLRQNAVTPRLVNRGYETTAGQKGTTVDIPIASAITAADVTAANTPPSTSDVSPTYVSIPLDQWKEAAFYLTDKDIQESMSGTIPMQAAEAVKVLCNTIDSYILALYKGIYGYVGTAATTPFSQAPANFDMSDATNVRTTLNTQLAPLSDRRLILDPSAEGKALLQRPIQDASWRGQGQAAAINGMIGTSLGFDWFMNQNVPTHTAGTITTGLKSKTSTAYAVGVTTIVATTAATSGACALVVGDILTFAGDTQTYVLTAAATQASPSTDVTLTFLPALKVAIASANPGVTISVKSSHVVNLGLHRDCIAFATRPFSDVRVPGSIIETAIDEITGIALRLEITREHKRTRWSFDALYGGKVVRPELGCRLAG